MEKQVEINGKSYSIRDIVESGGDGLEKTESVEELHNMLALIGELSDMMLGQVKGVTTVMSVDPVADIVPRRFYAMQVLTRPYRRKLWKRERRPRFWGIEKGRKILTK